MGKIRGEGPKGPPTEEPKACRDLHPQDLLEEHRIVLKRDVALGAGTRKAGEHLGTIVLQPGVAMTEFMTAIANPLHLR
jgi:hypothetical protein